MTNPYRHPAYARLERFFVALDWPTPARLLTYFALLGVAWLAAPVFGFSVAAVGPYVWAGACYAFAVFVFPFCAYGWIEFLRPRQYWVLPVGTVLAFGIGALVEAAQLHYPDHAHAIFMNCVVLPFLPYILLSKWRFIRFLYYTFRSKITG